MCTLILEYGMPVESWYAEFAFRRRVSMSAIGSVIVMALWPSSPRFPAARRTAGTSGVVGGRRSARIGYQLDFVMPGSSPRCAIERRQIRHRPNLRYTARGRPQREHRV